MLRGWVILLRGQIVLVLFYFYPKTMTMFLFCSLGGTRAIVGTPDIYVCTSTHTSFFGPGVVYPEVLNKCDHKLVLIIKNAE